MYNKKYQRKTDANHVAIANHFRSHGFSVQDMSAVGGGFPDILVAINGVSYLVEIKSSKGQLNQLQVDFHRNWQGQVFVVRSLSDVDWIVDRISGKIKPL